MNDKFTSIVFTINVDHHRKRIGLDGVTIAPTDKHKQNITVFTLARQLGLSGSLLFYYAYLK